VIPPGQASSASARGPVGMEYRLRSRLFPAGTNQGWIKEERNQQPKGDPNQMKNLFKKTLLAACALVGLGGQLGIAATFPDAFLFPNNIFFDGQSRVGLDGKERLVWNIAPGATTYGGSIIWILDGQGNFLASGQPQIPATVGWPGPGGNERFIVQGQADGNTTVAFIFPNNAIGVWTYNSAGALISSATYGPFVGTTVQDMRFAANGKIVVQWATTSGASLAWSLNEFGSVETTAGPFGPFAGTTLGTVDLASDNTQRWSWSTATGGTQGNFALWSFNSAGQVVHTVQFGPF